MEKYYTYAYLREDGTPYYVGKGNGTRIDSHHRTFNPPPKERRIFLKQNLSEQDAFKHEIYMISILGRKDLGTGILHNRTDGGEGGGPMKGRMHSEETKKKMRESTLGNKDTDEVRLKKSLAHKGIKYPNRKRPGPQSPEHIKKRMEARRKTMLERRSS